VPREAKPRSRAEISSAAEGPGSGLTPLDIGGLPKNL
jgi:hypothetical protein